jgi:hypothetical protein
MGQALRDYNEAAKWFKKLLTRGMQKARPLSPVFTRWAKAFQRIEVRH